MSNRNAESSKAIRQFWNNERNLVLQGEGTRQWDQKQQEAILDGGRPKDENGYSFHGHHMKSVSMYPEYQGDPNNIQALSKEEHLLAHSNCTQNATNGRFDYKTGVTHDFGDNPPTSCPIVKLHNPVISSKKTVVKDDYAKKETNTTNEIARSSYINVKNNIKNKKNEKTSDTFANGISRIGQFYTNNKSEINTLLGSIAIEIVGQAIVSKRNKTKQTNNNKIISTTTNAVQKNHSSPSSHVVNAHSQRYHTKNGIVIKNKPSYHRGEKNK